MSNISQDAWSSEEDDETAVPGVKNIVKSNTSLPGVPSGMELRGEPFLDRRTGRYMQRIAVKPPPPTCSPLDEGSYSAAHPRLQILQPDQRNVEVAREDSMPVVQKRPAEVSTFDQVQEQRTRAAVAATESILLTAERSQPTKLRERPVDLSMLRVIPTPAPTQGPAVTPVPLIGTHEHERAPVQPIISRHKVWQLGKEEHSLATDLSVPQIGARPFAVDQPNMAKFYDPPNSSDSTVQSFPGALAVPENLQIVSASNLFGSESKLGGKDSQGVVVWNGQSSVVNTIAPMDRKHLSGSGDKSTLNEAIHGYTSISSGASSQGAHRETSHHSGKEGQASTILPRADISWAAGQARSLTEQPVQQDEYRYGMYSNPTMPMSAPAGAPQRTNEFQRDQRTVPHGIPTSVVVPPDFNSRMGKRLPRRGQTIRFQMGIPTQNSALDSGLGAVVPEQESSLQQMATRPVTSLGATNSSNVQIPSALVKDWETRTPESHTTYSAMNTDTIALSASTATQRENTGQAQISHSSLTISSATMPPSAVKQWDSCDQAADDTVTVLGRGAGINGLTLMNRPLDKPIGNGTTTAYPMGRMGNIMAINSKQTECESKHQDSQVNRLLGTAAGFEGFDTRSGDEQRDKSLSSSQYLSSWSNAPGLPVAFNNTHANLPMESSRHTNKFATGTMAPSLPTAGHVHQKQPTDATRESTKPVGHVWGAGQIHTQRERIRTTPAEHGNQWLPTDRARTRELWRESRPSSEDDTPAVLASSRDFSATDRSIRETRLFTKF